ncbi:unnamed protein product [Heterobilharzia americana]|nr:unnamed protein product [Heterobilharzia americana]
MKNIIQMTVLVEGVPYLMTTVPDVSNKHSFLHLSFLVSFTSFYSTFRSQCTSPVPVKIVFTSSALYTFTIARKCYVKFHSLIWPYFYRARR